MLQKLYYLEGADLRDAIEKLNTLHSWVNNNIDSVLAVLRNARFTVNGGLYKKDHEKMRAILDTTPYRAFIRSMVYSKYLSTDIVSTIKGKNCDLAKYLKLEILVMDRDKVVESVARLSHHDYGTVMAAIEENRRLYEVAEKAVDAYRSTQHGISQFTKL